MRILVTGGAGFIGSHVVDACLAEGHEVAVVDDLSSGSREHLDGRARWYRVDIREPALQAVFEAERPEVVCHHAAQVSVRRSVEEPLADASVNVLGTLNVLEAARGLGTRRIVFASTGGAIYGEQDGAPADESHPCRPRSPYAVGKLAAEHYLDCFRAAYGLETVVLRYANVYGPRQDPHGEAGVVAIFLQRVLAGLPPTIYGDGGQVRDFVYVTDVVAANLAALRLRHSPGAQATFNIGTGRGTSVSELWAVVAAVTRAGVAPYHEPPRTGDVRRSVLDPGRAGRGLGWSPEVTLAAGIRRTWDWFVARAGRATEAAA